jgi:hypothetical protein
MYSLFLGAGFSKWAANLPLVSGLFDFDVAAFNRTDEGRIEAAKLLKRHWDGEHPGGNNEQFIAYATGLPDGEKDCVFWYVARRLAEPFIWKEFRAQRWRRHVLSIDEHRKFGVDDLLRASVFLQGFVGLSMAGVITTNYDMVVEYALGTRGFNYGVVNQELVGRGPYPVSTWQSPVRVTGKTRLAKIHGSISWDEKGYYTDGRRGITGDALIVAPASEKHIPEALRGAWDLAGQILGQSEKVLVFGFAFNPYDQLVLELLRSKGKNMRSVLLVDVEPNLRAAESLWPQARVTHCLPPPDGEDQLRGWKAAS